MKILIVRVSSLGDVVHNMPMVADILDHHPHAVVDWVVEEAYVSLVSLNSGVRRVIPFALRRWRKSLLKPDTREEFRLFRQMLREDTYDLVFDTQGLIKSSVVMRMARLAPGGRRIGLANASEGSGYEPISRIFHSTSVPLPARTHAVARARLVAAAALGYELSQEADFRLRPPVSPKGEEPKWLPARPYAVFFHGTARAAKRWPDQDWIEVAAHVNQRGMPVLLAWGSEEEEQAARRLATSMRDAQVLPRLQMMEAVILAYRAALVVGLDTGLTHIAAAYLRPTVELYCDSPRWKTEGNWSNRIINLGDEGCPPSVLEVVGAIDQLL